MLDINTKTQAIIDKIKTTGLASEIILFGSYANGNVNIDSDIDLCIITDETQKRSRDIIREIRKAISPIAELPVDLVVYAKNDFNSRAKLNTTFEYKIKEEGISLYEQQ